MVKTNIHKLISKEFINWPKDDVIYIGSRCDPYIPLEEQYGLTRKCLEELNELKISCMIATKSATKTIYRDLDLFQRYTGDLTILFGISNLEQLKNTPNSWEIRNIETINHLHDAGIKVWAFITPVLPGITDVEKIIGQIHGDIPVFLDKVRLEKSKRPGENMLSFLAGNYPHLKSTYEEIIYHGKDPYCETLQQVYENSPRVKFVFA